MFLKPSMKKVIITLSVFILLSSCNESTNSTDKTVSDDSVGLSKPISIDTIKHPAGVVNSSAISTDTAAMNVQNTIKKADSIDKKKKK